MKTTDTTKQTIHELSLQNSTKSPLIRGTGRSSIFSPVSVGEQSGNSHNSSLDKGRQGGFLGKGGVFGFTLVELIIVITILAILATIAYMSFQNYAKDSRDAVRVSDITSASKGLTIFFTKSGIYPSPEDSISITASGAVISNQGKLGESTVRAINMSQVPLDPVDQTKYIYSTNNIKSKYQLMIFTEHSNLFSLLPQTYATDFSNRGVETNGDDIGIVLNADNSPISSALDVFTSTGTYNAYVNKDITFQGTGKVLADLKDLDYYKKKIEIKTTAGKYKVLIIYQTSHLESGIYYTSHEIENGYKNRGFQVIVDTGALTLEKVKRYSPDIIGCDERARSCNYSFLNSLYDNGYKIASIGNDSTNAIYPILSSTYTNSDYGKVLPNNTFHFIGRGWDNIINSRFDSRYLINTIPTNAVSLAKESGNPSTSAVYLEESGKGKWIHFQTPIINQELLDRANAYMLK